MTATRPLRLRVPGHEVDEVSATVHDPAEPAGGAPAVLLTHGAGGTKDAEGLVALADGLAGEGITVVRANLPFREAGRRFPPRADKSIAPFEAVLDAARDELDRPDPWVIGGKSYGGRVASLAVAGGLRAAGLLFYGYPLHPPGKSDQLRVEHWPDIHVACLFLQGTEDGLCRIDLLEEHLGTLAVDPQIEIVEGGDHSLRIATKHAPDDRVHHAEEVLARLAPTVASWVRSL